jgi:hypothetical protein
MGCVGIFSTEVTTVTSQKMPWPTDSYVTMLTDAMLSLDILQYYRSTNCTYFECPLLYNSRTYIQFQDLKYNIRNFNATSGPYTQFQDLKCNFRTLKQVSMLLIASVENRERYGCVMVCCGIIIIVCLKSAQTFEILTRNAQVHRNKGSNKS